MAPKAYVISELRILDEKAADRYRALATRSIAAHGGRYLVRGAAGQMLEGTRTSEELTVIVEFPSVERASAWYRSPEYARALTHRDAALVRRLSLVEGVPS